MILAREMLSWPTWHCVLGIHERHIKATCQMRHNDLLRPLFMWRSSWQGIVSDLDFQATPCPQLYECNSWSYIMRKKLRSCFSMETFIWTESAVTDFAITSSSTTTIISGKELASVFIPNFQESLYYSLPDFSCIFSFWFINKRTIWLCWITWDPTAWWK